MKKNDLKEINKLRKAEDLPPIEPGTVVCLRCDAKFESWDKRNNRVCDECKNDDDYGSQCETHELSEYVLSKISKRPYDQTERYLLELERRFYGGYVDNDLLLDTTLMDWEG